MSDQKPTQLVEVLTLLKEREAVCGTELLGRYIPRYAAVIHKLRGQGFTIETRPCTRNHTHDSPQVEYHLTAVPNPIEDGSLELEAQAADPLEPASGRLFEPEPTPSADHWRNT